MSRGFILIEVSVVTVVIALALTAFLPLFIVSIRANKAAERIAAATRLSSELLEEVRLHRWDEKTPVPSAHIASPSAIGIDAAETASDKRTFDDIDDFNGWSENPPQDPVMRPLSALSAYTRTVSVKYVDASLNNSASPTDYKQVTVCTSAPKLNPVCLDTLLTNR